MGYEYEQSHDIIGQNKIKFGSFVFASQALFLVLFGVFAEYDDVADASHEKASLDPDKGGFDRLDTGLNHTYSMFQDVHIMMFVGFGYLMTFLKRYGYGSISFNFMISAFCIQWATLMAGFLHLHHGKIQLNIVTLLSADFCCAAVLISYGAVLGKVSPLQLLVMTFLEVVIFQVNEWVGLKHLGAVDIGGSMFVHVFGAYFGMAVARVLYSEEVTETPAKEKEGPVYHSDFFSMLGTLFLWAFWPSFNSALAPGDDRHRAVVNTYYALCASTLIAFALSAVVDKDGKFHTDHIQNATLAGGVAVGTTADMMIQPWGAMLIGCVAGAISVLGFRYLHSLLEHRLKIHDTCGVHNLHGMPGLLAGIAGAIAASMATTKNYGYGLYEIFPARAPMENTTEYTMINDVFTIDPGYDRSAGTQAGMQAAALFMTLAVAIVGGIITGLVLKIPIWDQPTKEALFDDEPYWLIPLEGFPHVIIDDVIVPNKSERSLSYAMPPGDDGAPRRMSLTGGIIVNVGNKSNGFDNEGMDRETKASKM